MSVLFWGIITRTRHSVKNDRIDEYIYGYNDRNGVWTIGHRTTTSSPVILHLSHPPPGRLRRSPGRRGVQQAE